MENPPPSPSADGPDLPPAPNPPPQRRRRRWPWFFAAGFLLLLAVLWLFPVLLSSSLGRPLLIRYIDQQLNGRIEIKNCSLGWLHGTRIDGLAVFDSNGRQVLQVVRLNTGWTFLSALRGRYSPGQVRAEGIDVLISHEPDGSLNWDHLITPDSSWVHAGKSLTGDFSIEQGSATYEDRFDPAQPPVFLRSIEGNVSVHQGAVSDKLAGSAQIGGFTSGTVQLSGWLAPSPDHASRVKQLLTTHNMDIGAVQRRLGSAWKLVGTSKGGAVFKCISSTATQPHD